jgi:chromosome segregation ATPase
MKSMRFVLDEQKTNSGATIKELEGVVKALRAQVDASADVSALMTTHEHELSKQKSAHAEAIESVKAKHEELIELRVAEVTSRVTDEMKDLRAHVTEQKSLNKKLDGDLVRMRRDLENAHTESSDLRGKLMAESQRADSFGSQAATSTQKAELEKKNLMEAMRESYAREKASLESEKAAYAREKEEAAALVSIFLFPYRQCE